MVDALVLRTIDQGQQDGRREPPLVQSEIFEALPDHGALVVVVEDQEVPAHAHALAVPAEDPAADVMECADPDRPRHRRPHQPVDTHPHLVGGFVGERDGQHAGRRDAAGAQQVCDPIGEHAGLSAAGAGQDQ